MYSSRFKRLEDVISRDERSTRSLAALHADLAVIAIDSSASEAVRLYEAPFQIHLKPALVELKWETLDEIVVCEIAEVVPQLIAESPSEGTPLAQGLEQIAVRHRTPVDWR